MHPDLRPAPAHTAIEPKRSSNIAYAGLLASITAMVAAGLLVRLNSFPGLHGDEAWVGLRALEQQTRGMFTLRGMNGYTGSLFPLLAFSLGCWSHAIFIAAALSFAAATLLVALKWPGESSARLLLIGQLNLLVQIVLCGRHFVGDGAFATRALPALLAGLGLIALATHAYARVEGYLLPRTIRALTDRRVARLANVLLVGFVVLSLAASPIGDVSFFGTVSGMILLERVVSYLPGPIEMIALHLRMVLLLALFAAATLTSFRSKPSEPEQLLLPLFCLWTIAYFPALRLSIASVADRYYIIPQFLLFVSIALAIVGFRASWKMPAIALLLAGFVHAQVTMAREAFRDADRPPFELFDYAGYTDTSRHFMRLDALTNELKSRATCRVESSSFFIAQPMRFLMAVGQPCTGNAEMRVEYCAACLAPVRGFELQLQK